jgi:hypothetical protein
VLALLLAGLVAGPADSPVPLAAGTWWEYREAYTEYVGPLDSTEESLTRFRVHRGRRGPYIAQSGGADPVSGPAEVGDGYLRLSPWTGEEALPLPLAAGGEGPVVDASMAPWRVEAVEDLEVPAGRFRTLRCANRTRTTESVLWIAPGVGVVRETHGPPGRRPEIERVLLRWSGGGAPLALP